MAAAAPFSPTFGISPPVLAGRDDVLADMDEVIDGNIYSPACASLLLGIRGMGKTALLNAIEDRARGQGWLTISESGYPAGLVSRITLHASELVRSLDAEDSPPARRRITGAALMGAGIATEMASEPERPPPSLTMILTSLGERLAERGCGLLISIDELHDADTGEVREFGSIFQLASRRRELPVAFAGAALPELRHTVLSGAKSTFLQRCAQYDLGPLEGSEAEQALLVPMEQAGGTIGAGLLRQAAEASGGHPFMVQLIGARVWSSAADPAAGITAAEVQRGIDEARQRFGGSVYGPVWSTLTGPERRFLIAMIADDDRPSAVSAVGSRWGRPYGSLSTYRRRLINKGMIESAGRGRVRFVRPGARDYAITQARQEGWTLDDRGAVNPPDIPEPGPWNNPLPGSTQSTDP
ncbi:MAG: ATP-binding protein [Acidimicrobiaceae bacterium]|nr:ATP-binding protein [Acidimicrobiaceae bacterium]